MEDPSLRPVRLAVLFDQHIHEGGGYQQALNAALVVQGLSPDLVEPVFFTTLPDNVPTLNRYGIPAQSLRFSRLREISMMARRQITHPAWMILVKRLLGANTFETFFTRQGFDLLYFLAPTALAANLEHLNYIIPVWDFCHRDDPEFPEVRLDWEFEVRERFYHRILPKATAVLVDAESSRGHACGRYGLDPERVHVMPFAPAPGTRISEDDYQAGFIDIGRKYALSVPYVFYPAQFWAHKNHVYLLQGLKRLADRFGHRIGAIFAGGDKGNLAYVKEMTSRLGLTETIRFAGFVPDQEMPYLYRQSVALVMPSYFGPTNLPPLEAFALGVPVLYPDKAGLREQAVSAALLMNLQDPDSLARHLNDLLTQPELRRRLVMDGHSRLIELDACDRPKVLDGILRDFQARCATWRSLADMRRLN